LRHARIRAQACELLLRAGLELRVVRRQRGLRFEGGRFGEVAASAVPLDFAAAGKRTHRGRRRLIWLLVCAVLAAMSSLRRVRLPLPRSFRRGIQPAAALARASTKPAWVVRQLILLKAHMPDAGCRTLALTFNRVFAHEQVSVSKSYVHRALREHAYAVWLARKAIRSAKPHAVPTNHCWGIDLTGRADALGCVHTILGILDHGSRVAVALKAVPRKCGWTILGHLCLAIARFGKPHFIRTDNEACFTGRVLRAGLRIFGMRHQRIDLHCPWQNGRIERFFGTLKPYLRQWSFCGRRQLDAALCEFAAWYNEIRPHANLGGATPLEAWNEIDPYHAPTPPKSVNYSDAWEGLLAGFRIHR